MHPGASESARKIRGLRSKAIMPERFSLLLQSCGHWLGLEGSGCDMHHLHPDDTGHSSSFFSFFGEWHMGVAMA